MAPKLTGPLLGGVDVGRQLPVPQLAEVEVAGHPVDADGLVPAQEDVARALDEALALGHARSGDAIAIGSYLGGGTRFDEAMSRFASSYADQNELDHQALKFAIATNKIHAISDV